MLNAMIMKMDMNERWTFRKQLCNGAEWWAYKVKGEHRNKGITEGVAEYLIGERSERRRTAIQRDKAHGYEEVEALLPRPSF